MLNILAMAYEGVPVGTDIPTARRQIFAAYVQRMLTRRGSSTAYSLEQTQIRLAYLAHQLVKRNQTVFYIEHLQPDWLPYRSMFYRLLLMLLNDGWDYTRPAETLIWSWHSVRAIFFRPTKELIGSLGVGLRYGLRYGLLLALPLGLVSGLVEGLGVGLVIGLVLWLLCGLGGILLNFLLDGLLGLNTTFLR